MTSKILIADDSPQLLRVLKWILESHSGYWKICAEAVDGQQAVEKAVETKPQLIIIDLQMPRLDGLSASSKIGKLLPGVPILIFTLHKSDHVDQEAKHVGVREVIPKSDTGALVRAIEQLLGKNPEPVAPVRNEHTS